MTQKTLTLTLTEQESNVLQTALQLLIEHNSDLAEYKSELQSVASKNVNAQYKNKIGATWDLWGKK